MAKPDLKEAAFPGGLHKKKGYQDKGTVTANTPLGKGWPVKVTGHKGKKPTVWVGKVGDPTTAKDTWEVVELAVTDEQQPRPVDKKDRDTEDVSTTVTNPTPPPAESQPVVAPATTIP
jgi:hypothetical protein